MQPIRTKKITQPLVTMHALFWDKKTCNLLRQKNHPTSRDKKKSHNLLGQKEITQPLGTKKKSRNLLGQEKITQPLRTKKLCNLSGQNKSRNLFGQKKKHNISRPKK